MYQGPSIKVKQLAEKLSNDISNSLQDAELCEALGKTVEHIKQFKSTIDELSQGDISLTTIKNFQDNYQEIAANIHNQSSSWSASWITTTIYDPFKGGAAYTMLQNFREGVEKIEAALKEMKSNDRMHATASPATFTQDLNHMKKFRP